MKVCSKCGATQSDDRLFCVDCGETLGKSLSESEEKAVRQQTEQKIDGMYNKTYPLFVSKPDNFLVLPPWPAF